MSIAFSVPYDVADVELIGYVLATLTDCKLILWNVIVFFKANSPVRLKNDKSTLCALLCYMAVECSI